METLKTPPEQLKNKKEYKFDENMEYTIKSGDTFYSVIKGLLSPENRNQLKDYLPVDKEDPIGQIIKLNDIQEAIINKINTDPKLMNYVSHLQPGNKISIEKVDAANTGIIINIIKNNSMLQLHIFKDKNKNLQIEPEIIKFNTK